MKKSIVRVGDLHLAFSPKVQAQLHEKQMRYPYLPEPQRILFDLQELSTHGGVPAAIKQHQSGNQLLLFYTSSYYVAAYPSDRQDGYSVSHVDALNLHEHERLANQGVIWLQAHNWYWYASLSNIAPGSSNHWKEIWKTWNTLVHEQRSLNQQVQQEEISPAHENYLNTLETLIETAHLLEEDKYKLSSLLSYRLIESTDAKRYAPRDVYIFHLSGNPQISEKTLVRLKEAPDLQGQVIAVKENTITVKFHGLIDRSRIRSQGNLEPVINSAVFRAQRQAIDTLRQQQSRNTHLLRALVDHCYQPYTPARVMPAQKLNAEQLAAFQHALTVPDLLLVLGPPGTGKTRTITEIVRECSARRQRVLIASGTHKAVDNVLERLDSTNLLMVRVGHEDRISERIRLKLLEEQAAELQKSILEQTEYAYRRLAIFIEHKSTLDQWLTQLQTHTNSLFQIRYYTEDMLRRSNASRQRIEAPYAPRLRELEISLQKYTDTIQKWQNKVNAWAEKRLSSNARSPASILGPLFRWLGNYYTGRMEGGQQKLNDASLAYKACQQAYQSIQAQLYHALQVDVAYQSSEENRRKAEQHAARLQSDVLTLVNNLNGTLQHLAAIPSAWEKPGIEQLTDYLNWYHTQQTLLEKRATLLHQWRKKLEARNEQQLNPELLRYADVVGATCIGTATARGLEEIEFDVAVVDEAGQISLPDLLVPLVRARRSVLVGDHHQLPPFVDREVQTWLDGLSPQALESLGITDEDGGNEYVVSLLTKSAFEQLFTAWGHNADMVSLKEQRRMPKAIADFAARHFYGGRLDTYQENNAMSFSSTDPVFTHPLVFIDTTEVPFKLRRERQFTPSQSWEEVGISNKLEAELIAEIATVYDRAAIEWVVIVPYRAQAQLIIRLLREKEQVDEQELRLEERVATVDSFQGRESRLVIYGFTRSNDRHSIGFLAEERRLNVAMTRAKERLVLVGDLSTLTNSTDKDFNRLILSLAAHIDQCGEILPYTRCRDRLRALL